MKVAEGVLPPRGAAVKAPADNKRKWESAGKSVGSSQPQAKKQEVVGALSEQRSGVILGNSRSVVSVGFIIRVIVRGFAVVGVSVLVIMLRTVGLLFSYNRHRPLLLLPLLLLLRGGRDVITVGIMDTSSGIVLS
jgi:hypothetical protein